MKRVYHGSYTEIDEINLSLCKVSGDFGRGFYVTCTRSHAEYWAKRKSKENHNNAFITEFEFDTNIYRESQLKVLHFDDYNEEWLDFVALNRMNKKAQQAHNYDIVEGATADDDVVTRIYDYLNNNVSKEQLLMELTHKTPLPQICFCSAKALQILINKKSVPL